MKVKVKTMILFAGLVVAVTFVSLFLDTNNFSDLQQNACEKIDGRWAVDHCIIRQEAFDFFNLTCDNGTTLEDGTCQSNGIKLVLESYVEPITNTNQVLVKNSPAYDICSNLALECDYDNGTTSYVGIKKGDEIIISLDLEGRGQNYTMHLDAAAVENMDGNYIRNIEVTTEDKPIDYSVDNDGKIDLFNIPLPIDEKYNQVDYGKLGYLVAENDLKSKLQQRNIAYSEENYTFRQGFTLSSNPPHSGYCALVKSDDGKDYWYEGGFHRDTLSRSELHNNNPNSCEPNSFSCTCSIIKDYAIDNVGTLSYFDELEERATAKALQEYLKFTKVSNVPNQFVVGKYNFDYDGDYVSFCGKFVEQIARNTFEGAIKDNAVTSFSLRPPMELCAINYGAIVYEFEYVGNED